jgi:hypothetical protein
VCLQFSTFDPHFDILSKSFRPLEYFFDIPAHSFDSLLPTPIYRYQTASMKWSSFFAAWNAAQAISASPILPQKAQESLDTTPPSAATIAIHLAAKKYHEGAKKQMRESGEESGKESGSSIGGKIKDPLDVGSTLGKRVQIRSSNSKLTDV